MKEIKDITLAEAYLMCRKFSGIENRCQECPLWLWDNIGRFKCAFNQPGYMSRHLLHTKVKEWKEVKDEKC